MTADDDGLCIRVEHERSLIYRWIRTPADLLYGDRRQKHWLLGVVILADPKAAHLEREKDVASGPRLGPTLGSGRLQSPCHPLAEPNPASGGRESRNVVNTLSKDCATARAGTYTKSSSRAASTSYS